MAKLASVTQSDDAARVLSEGVARIASSWKLSSSQIGAIIGLSEPTVLQLRARHWRLQQYSKPFELSQHLLRLFRSLDSWLGQDDAAARSWLASPNLDLGAAPLTLIASKRGLIRTADYVDALCAQV